MMKSKLFKFYYYFSILSIIISSSGDSIFCLKVILCRFLKSNLRLAHKKAQKYIINDKTLNPSSKPCRLYRKSTMSNREHAPVFPQLSFHKRQHVSIIWPRTTGPGNHPEKQNNTRLSACCLTPTQQFFIYIMARTS